VIISIQSQVVHGHVGNSAAVFPLQHLGIPVAAVPTTLLSNHPHYPTMRGRILDADLLGDLLAGVEERGLVERCAILVTGYLGSVANGEVVAAFVERAKRRNPGLRYCCDPVMGDADLGFFVDPGLPALFLERLVPMADILTPNCFEFEHLAGLAAPDEEALRRGVAALGGGGRVVAVTGVGLGGGDSDAVRTYGFHEGKGWVVATPHLACRPAGTGDLFTALFVAALIRGEGVPAALEASVSGMFAVLAATAEAGSEEMLVVASREAFARPRRRFRAVRLEVEGPGRRHPAG
jgi:pyridoxine kinase